MHGIRAGTVMRKPILKADREVALDETRTVNSMVVAGGMGKMAMVLKEAKYGGATSYQ